MYIRCITVSNINLLFLDIERLDTSQHADSIQIFGDLLARQKLPLDSEGGHLVSEAWLKGIVGAYCSENSWTEPVFRIEYRHAKWPIKKIALGDEFLEECRNAITCPHGNAKIFEHCRTDECRVIPEEVSLC